ncbi:S-adenosyl-L-methionine-dependent methyltransferase [Tothia fuscella]|uniref:S-adenosyl-L-methionine-dependent methyltransferase n=1 Tax=Tothia fuscella TaxID=1048955 RepID=A0A9P4NK23_9PEZI|nr:S-adenosyl-L-methionine-dependent methyltransferase [Tothia fuscella]
MSLYYEAAAILSNTEKVGGSLKSRIYSKKDLKSSPANIYALVSETSKWSAVLKEVVERSGILRIERKLDPTLAILLVHDLLLARRGIAAPTKHALRVTVEKHKARLNAEFTKARLRREFVSLEAFRESVNSGEKSAPISATGSTNGTSNGTTNGATNGVTNGATKPKSDHRHPRWVRVNILRTTLQEQLNTTFMGFRQSSDIAEILSASGKDKVLHIDKHIPDLLALPSRFDLTKSRAYQEGLIIFQDKASCFPAYLLSLDESDSDMIDACAAPGNKTTHLAAFAARMKRKKPRIHAFERSAERSKTLVKMVKLAGAENKVKIWSSTDFLATKAADGEFESVTAILLDPSCSGSGIVGRDDEVPMILPRRQEPQVSTKSKKRKKSSKTALEANLPDPSHMENEKTLEEEEEALTERLTTLSSFQAQILDHAMRFPSARKIVYSTCSIYAQENEEVVMKALTSDIAKEQKWRLLRRSEQVLGLAKWETRGDKIACLAIMKERSEALKQDFGVEVLAGEQEKFANYIADNCIRCEKGTGEGTMGFFAAGFVRDFDDKRMCDNGVQIVEALGEDVVGKAKDNSIDRSGIEDQQEEEEWKGFSDDDVIVNAADEIDPPISHPEMSKIHESRLRNQSQKRWRWWGVGVGRKYRA